MNLRDCPLTRESFAMSNNDTQSIEKTEKMTCLSIIGNIFGVFGAFALIGDMITDSFSAKNYYERSLLNGTDADSYHIYFICTTTFICLPVTIGTLILGIASTTAAIIYFCELAWDKVGRRWKGCCCAIWLPILAIISVFIFIACLFLSFIVVAFIWIFSPMLHIFFSLMVLLMN